MYNQEDAYVAWGTETLYSKLYLEEDEVEKNEKGI